MPRPSSVHPRSVAAVGVALVLALALAVGAAGARAGTVAVTGATTGPAIPAAFTGISTETYDLEKFTGTDPTAIDPAFLALFRQIAPGGRPVLRIGGDSTDWSWYPVPGHRRPPGVTYTITPGWLRVARATAADLDASLVLGVNLEAGSVADARGEADAMEHVIGRRYIRAIEIGNEPELYHKFAWYHTRSGARVFGRPADYTEADYFDQFSEYARALRGLPVAGPVLGVGNWLDELGGFLQAEPHVSLVTFHAYPLQHCTPSTRITIPDVLASSSSAGFVAGVAPFVRAARAHHKAVRIDELNAISCGGTKGVSDSFGSALWMVNTLFGLARAGVDGVNVHMTPGAINAILDPVGSGPTSAISVQPEYYAMMLFAQAAPAGARILRLRTAGLGPDVQVWATRDQSGSVRVVLVNKSATASATTSLSVPGASGAATVEALRARSLAATQGVTLGGQTFGARTSTGELAGPSVTRTIARRDGRYVLTVPAASAEMVTLRPPAGSRLLALLARRRRLPPLL